MLPPQQTCRIHVAFDGHRLMADVRLLCPFDLPRRLGLGELVDRHVGLRKAPVRANAGDAMLRLVASALASGSRIDEADVLRDGGTEGVEDV